MACPSLPLPPPQPANSRLRQALSTSSLLVLPVLPVDTFALGLAELLSRRHVMHLHITACMLQKASTGVADVKALPKLDYEFNALEPYVSIRYCIGPASSLAALVTQVREA